VNGVAKVGTSTYATGMIYSGYIEAASTSDGNRIFPMVNTSTTGAGWGYIGDNDTYWYYVYSQNLIDPSRRELKKNIMPIDNNIYELVMADIDKIHPTFYRYKNETEELESGNESKFRPNMHLGVILDESPDYIQDNAFSGIDVYAISTLSLAGVKHNRLRINNNENIVKELIDAKDFGVVNMNTYSKKVKFSNEFKNMADQVENNPVIMLTPMSPNTNVYVTDVSKSGFTIVSENGIGMDVSWMAFTKVIMPDINKGNIDNIPSSLMRSLKVDESQKSIIKNYEEKVRQEQLNSIKK